MRSSWMLAAVLSLGATGCPDASFPCTRYCWSHRQVVPDITDKDMTGVPDGRFDIACTKFFDLEDWYPPLPPFGWYSGERCLGGSEHEIIAATVAAIQDPMVDATQGCDVTDLQVYAELVEELATQARDACIAHLSCNGSPVGCDIDPSTDGPQACTLPSAQSICDQIVLAPALAALNDLTHGPGSAQPQRDGTVVEYIEDPQDCEPLLHDTDGTPSCEVGPAGDGADETTGTTGEEGSEGPFGDLDALVTWESATICIVEPELLLSIQRNFGVFYDDGVWLERVDLPGIGRGIRISGLHRGKASTELLAAFGIENDDVVSHVDGASLGSPEAEHALKRGSHKSVPDLRFLRIGLDDGGAGLSEIYDLYLDLDDCHGADCRLVELEYYDDDDDPDPYEPGDETVHGLDLSSLGVSRAVQLALLSQHDTETMRTVAVAARDEAKTPSVLAVLAGLGQRRGMTPILAAAPRALAVGQGDTVWLATHPRERRCLLRIGAADPNALKAELAILDDYLVLEDTTL